VPNLKIKDAGREYTYQIEGDAASVGRGDTNDVDLADAKASKEHVRIERSGARWKLIDLESKNGTKVNGEFKNKAWLGHGDVVQIGTAELRFGLEAAARTATATRPARAAAPGRDPDEEGDEEEELPRRRAKRSNALLISAISSVALLLIILLSVLGGKSSNNGTVLARGKALAEAGQWREAIQYMEQYGEPEHDDYVLVKRELDQLREGLAAHERNVRNEEAKKIVARLGMLIRSYNVGQTKADEILPLVKQLREKYADTEIAQSIKKDYPAWWAGKTPQPASELLAGGSRLEKDWEAAVARSEEYRKENAFREAKETIERFVSEREAILGAGDLATYEQLRDDELLKIDNLAESVFRGRQAEAERLLKNKRYDQAIAAYREVVEKFGLDVWVRRAQAEISKIEQMKASGK
jgi:hypothetical protein